LRKKKFKMSFSEKIQHLLNEQVKDSQSLTEIQHIIQVCQSKQIPEKEVYAILVVIFLYPSCRVRC
jgi:hypothetical protein